MKKLITIILLISMAMVLLAQPVQQPADGNVILAADSAIPGNDINPDASFNNSTISNWKEGSVSWSLTTTRKSTFSAIVNFAGDWDPTVSLTITVSSYTLTQEVTTTGGWGTYEDRTIGDFALNPGTYTLTLRVNNPAINFDHITLSRHSDNFMISTNVNNADYGWIAKSPNKSAYESGDIVNLMAVPMPGYQFASWEDSPAPENRTIIVDGHASYSAVFEMGAVFPDGNGRVILPASVARLNESGINYDPEAQSIIDWQTGAATWKLELSCQADFIIKGEIAGMETITTGHLNIAVIHDNIPRNIQGQYTTSGIGSNLYVDQELGSVHLDGGNYSVVINRVIEPGIDNAINLKNIKLENIATDNNQHFLTLTVNNALQGTISITPFKALYNTGDAVSITATPAAGYAFVNWTGDMNSTNRTETVTMNTNKNIQANFQLDDSGGFHDNKLENNITIFPNPFTNQLFITSPDNTGINTIRVMNVSGIVCLPELKVNAVAADLTKDITPLPIGMYIFRIETGTGILYRRVMKQ